VNLYLFPVSQKFKHNDNNKNKNKNKKKQQQQLRLKHIWNRNFLQMNQQETNKKLNIKIKTATIIVTYITMTKFTIIN
jgi:hypothetical protein